MILQTPELPPSQRTAIEEKTGRKPHPRQASPREQLIAVEQMRHRLWLLDPSERRMSIEEYAAALLEKAH